MQPCGLQLRHGCSRSIDSIRFDSIHEYDFITRKPTTHRIGSRVSNAVRAIVCKLSFLFLGGSFTSLKYRTTKFLALWGFRKTYLNAGPARPRIRHKHTRWTFSQQPASRPLVVCVLRCLLLLAPRGSSVCVLYPHSRQGGVVVSSAPFAIHFPPIRFDCSYKQSSQLAGSEQVPSICQLSLSLLFFCHRLVSWRRIDSQSGVYITIPYTTDGTTKRTRTNLSTHLPVATVAASS